MKQESIVEDNVPEFVHFFLGIHLGWLKVSKPPEHLNLLRHADQVKA